MTTRKRTELRRGLPPVPKRMRGRPLDHRGYPVPWFVAFINGAWDFRVVDTPKLNIAVEQRLCWLCGSRLGRWQTFVTGVMCAINRNTAEPPCHYDCAQFAAMACPFLVLPKSQRNEADLPAGVTEPPGVFITGNPGACCLYSSQFPYRIYYPDDTARFLITMPVAERLEFYCHGRPATHDERADAVAIALARLRATAMAEGPRATAMLDDYVTDFLLALAAQPK